GVRAEAAPACRWDQEHVEALGVDLEVADRLAFLFDDPRLDVLSRQPLLDLGAGERLVVPVARDFGIGVPGDETVDVGRAGRPQRRQSSAYENVHSTSPCFRSSSCASTKPTGRSPSTATSSSVRGSASSAFGSPGLPYVASSRTTPSSPGASRRIEIAGTPVVESGPSSTARRIACPASDRASRTRSSTRS